MSHRRRSYACKDNREIKVLEHMCNVRWGVIVPSKKKSQPVSCSVDGLLRAPSRICNIHSIRIWVVRLPVVSSSLNRQGGVEKVKHRSTHVKYSPCFHRPPSSSGGPHRAGGYGALGTSRRPRAQVTPCDECVVRIGIHASHSHWIMQKLAKVGMRNCWSVAKAWESPSTSRIWL